MHFIYSFVNVSPGFLQEKFVCTTVLYVMKTFPF